MSDASGKHIRSAIETSRRVRGRRDVSAENGIVARDVLHGEIGLNGPSERHEPYHLDADTRDILIAHGRQDAAHALLNTMTLVTEVASLRRVVVVLMWLNIITLIVSWTTSHY